MTFDPFQILGFQQRFDIDPIQVERRYLIAAAKAHPDRVTDPVQKQNAENQSAIINRARNALKDEESRARALLALQAPKEAADDKSLPDGFLIDILETRENLEEIKASNDPKAHAQIQQWANEQRTLYIANVAQSFQSTDPNRFADIKRQLNAWRYIERLIEQINV